jgi:hypothetical protein
MVVSVTDIPGSGTSRHHVRASDLGDKGIAAACRHDALLGRSKRIRCGQTL